MMQKFIIISAVLFITAFAGLAQKQKSVTQDVKNQSQITEITLERTACFGTCPIYKVTLKRDGTATYVGKQFVERTGTYSGKFYGFERLAQLIESRGYFDLKDNYTINATDLPSTVTSVVRAGRRKTITNYGDTGPVELWGIEQAIDGVLANTKWEKVSDK